MRVDTMRRIDFWVGVPLCFLVTPIVGLLSALGRRAPERPRRVLLVELSEMGSAILVDPAMQKLKNVLGAELHFAIFERNRASLELLDTVPRENVVTIRETSLVALALDSLKFLLWCRRRRIDAVIDLELFSRYTALLTGLSGAPRRAGFHAFHNEGLYRGDMLTHRVAYNPHQHMARNFIALVNALAAERPELPYSKTTIGEDEIRLRQTTVDRAQQEHVRAQVRAEYPGYDAARQRLVLVNPNASEMLPQRRWMPERYAELIRRILREQDDVLVLVTGAGGERAEAEALRGAVDDARCINFAGRLRLTELPALYSIALLLVTNDSGPGHFSAVTALPSFVLFGPETPALYGSLGNSTPIYAGLACSPCVSAANHRKTACRDNVCLKAITVERVFEAIRPVLEAGRGRAG